MVGQSGEIRRLISLVESFLFEKPKQPSAAFGLSKSSEFDESLKRNMRIFPDLREKLEKFIELKLADPLNSKYGKHDGPFKAGTPLAGFNHCHLRDDAVLIYTMRNRTLNLVLICTHAEMEGKNTMKLSKKLNSL